MPPILKKPRSWYEKHPQGEITYWTAQRDRQGAWGGFFWYDGLLIISNSPKQIQRTIALINNESSALKSIGDDKLFFQVLDACEFTGEKEQAAVILNTELLRNDPYYNRYYQGVPSERQTFKRVAFSFKFQDNIAEIIRASYPDNPELEIENKTLGEFLDYTPKNAFLYNEFAVSKFYSVETMLPFGELFSLQENDNPSLISAGCSWFPLDYEDSDITLILPIIFLKMDNPTHWIEPAKVHIADMATDTILKDYTSVWKTDGKVNFLCDMLGTELGFAYRIDGSVVLISSCSDALLKSKLGSPKIIKEHLQESEGISCNVIIPDKMASNVSKHLRILSEWDMIQSYSAEQFLKDFILPIGKDVLTNIELIRQVECFDENRKMFITKMSVKLK
ncbi:hypothetical protein DRQ33_07820 [bacterium]|nr:MAG: hypothetical protein DRQ33_07820 [bacterium]